MDISYQGRPRSAQRPRLDSNERMARWGLMSSSSPRDFRISRPAEEQSAEIWIKEGWTPKSWAISDFEAKRTWHSWSIPSVFSIYLWQAFWNRNFIDGSSTIASWAITSPPWPLIKAAISRNPVSLIIAPKSQTRVLPMPGTSTSCSLPWDESRQAAAFISNSIRIFIASKKLPRRK